MHLRYDSIERRKRIFALYCKAKRYEDNWIKWRKQGRHGIAVSTDECAIKWQQIQMRINIMEAYLSGGEPNWFNAKWLTAEQARFRNGG